MRQDVRRAGRRKEGGFCPGGRGAGSPRLHRCLQSCTKLVCSLPLGSMATSPKPYIFTELKACWAVTEAWKEVQGHPRKEARPYWPSPSISPFSASQSSPEEEAGLFRRHPPGSALKPLSPGGFLGGLSDFSQSSCDQGLRRPADFSRRTLSQCEGGGRGQGSFTRSNRKSCPAKGNFSRRPCPTYRPPPSLAVSGIRAPMESPEKASAHSKFVPDSKALRKGGGVRTTMRLSR